MSCLDIVYGLDHFKSRVEREWEREIEEGRREAGGGGGE